MCETGILPEQIGAGLEKFRPWTEIGTIATPAETRVQPRLPVRLERCRRFLPAKRVERASGPGRHLYPKSGATMIIGADTRSS